MWGQKIKILVCEVKKTPRDEVLTGGEYFDGIWEQKVGEYSCIRPASLTSLLIIGYSVKKNNKIGYYKTKNKK